MKGPIPFSTEEAALRGFTHILEVYFNDLTTAGLTQTLNLFPTIPGQRIMNAGWALKTNFAGGTATSLTASLGDSGGATNFCTAASVLGANSPIAYKTGDGAAFNQGGGKVYLAADNVQIAFTAVAGNVNTFTAGVLQIFLEIVRQDTNRTPIA